MLQLWAASELICLKYLDETGLNGVVHSITATAVRGNKNECINPAYGAGDSALWEYGNPSTALIMV
jgi:hypothetical protein